MSVSNAHRDKTARKKSRGKPSQIIAVDVVEHITLNCFIAQHFPDPRASPISRLFYAFDVYLSQDASPHTAHSPFFSAVMKTTSEQINIVKGAIHVMSGGSRKQWAETRREKRRIDLQLGTHNDLPVYFLAFSLNPRRYIVSIMLRGGGNQDTRAQLNE